MIGVPLSGSLQMEWMHYYQLYKCLLVFPVATVAINGSKNAAYLALQMMAVHHSDLKEKLLSLRKDMEKQAMNANQEIMEKYK